MPKEYTLAVIGGGAAGLLAAVQAAQELGGDRVAILEAAPRVGKKLLVTGNGRCNLTNLQAGPARYHGDVRRAAPILQAFPPKRILSCFLEMGLLCRTMEDGRVYPYSMQAATVLNVLRARLQQLGVAQHCGFAAVQVHRTESGYRVLSREGAWVQSRFLLVAGGGLAQAGPENAYALVRQLGHSTTPLRPALAPIMVQESQRMRALKGVRAHARVSLLRQGTCLRQTQGEVQFTANSLSGICVFELSREAQKGDVLSLDLVPEYTLPELQKLTGGRLEGVLPKALAQQCPFSACKAFCFTVEHTENFRRAQVTAGGVPLEQVTAGCQSLPAPGVWLAGELLNLDGDCGGFNLHWAWSSALCAVQSLIKEVRR